MNRVTPGEPGCDARLEGAIMIDPCGDCTTRPGIWDVYGATIVCDECLQNYARCIKCDVWISDEHWHVIEDGEDAIYLCDEPECWGEYLQQCDLCGEFRLNDDGGLSDDGSRWVCTECQANYWTDEEDED